MRNRLPQMLFLAAVSSGFGCSAPEEKEPRQDVSIDGGLEDRGPDTVDRDDVGTDSGQADGGFEFGFDAVPFMVTPSGVQTAQLTWNGTETLGQFFLMGRPDHVVGSLTFRDADDAQHAYRFDGSVDMAGEVALRLTERTCTSDGTACPDSPPANLTEMPVWDTVARYDGTRVVFAPFVLRPEALAASSGHEFRAPNGLVMVPNDGFKPAMVPDPARRWVGEVTMLMPSTSLSGTSPCVLRIQLTATHEVTEMSCGDATYVLDGDPGPVTASLDWQELDSLLQLDFVDGGDRLRFVGQVGDSTLHGVVLDAALADELPSPLGAQATDLRGFFWFEGAGF